LSIFARKGLRGVLALHLLLRARYGPIATRLADPVPREPGEAPARHPDVRDGANSTGYTCRHVTSQIASIAKPLAKPVYGSDMKIFCFKMSGLLIVGLGTLRLHQEIGSGPSMLLASPTGVWDGSDSEAHAHLH
jgi:hypothetical protein